MQPNVYVRKKNSFYSTEEKKAQHIKRWIIYSVWGCCCSTSRVEWEWTKQTKEMFHKFSNKSACLQWTFLLELCAVGVCMDVSLFIVIWGNFIWNSSTKSKNMITIKIKLRGKTTSIFAVIQINHLASEREGERSLVNEQEK